ncbi:hypothetical protein KUCAC02_012828 [Chaenocephalus aceratus]|uniref:Uncharacterized protein n=1 Tax=Chaenocephalus aceratus TaxID=36190 RepID=A0ACB9XDS0_CHAAC|nr:hypothetical protein KUCAC02_012828 [Chaenocephalus aceratus]
MGKGFFLSKPLGVGCIILGAGAVATIIALSVVYSQEKAKNQDGGTPTKPPATTVAPSNEPWDKYRLPKSLLPQQYNVTCGHGCCLTPLDSTSSLVRPQWIDSGVKAPSIKSSFLQIETQYLVLQLDGKLVKDHMYQLHTKFTGELADDLGGFYRSEYYEDGVKKVVATTQMQPTDARKAFPCFDEPAMKAVFHITLIHDIGTVALSNGEQKETSSVVIESQHVQKTAFGPTEKMSTYLLAFIVSDFAQINNTIDDVLIRIFARKPAIDAGQGQYALNKTGPILKFFEGYYSSKYPLPKSDQIALPDFNAGAMENWGLITYRETALLYDESFSSNSNKERIATIIAHELAHMWFGNLVTLRWWNDLWLNEGFASYVEYLGADNAEPDWNITDLIVLNDVHRVFAVDALTSSHPLSSKEEDIQRPAQISELFDAISYSKGASVLRMLSDFLTEGVFTQGLTSYLNTFAFGNAVYTDLWEHLQMAVDNNNGTKPPDSVNNIMNTWVLQMGFPVVTIDTQTGGISQKHFLLDPDSTVTVESPFNYEWIVPIKWMKTGVIHPTIKWLKAKSDTVNEMKTSGPSDWVLANLNVLGYYRVNYDQGNWDRLLIALRDNRSSIPVINRAQLVDDAFNLARAKIIPTVLALETTKYLTEERDYVPWKSAVNNLDFFYLMFDRSEVMGPCRDPGLQRPWAAETPGCRDPQRPRDTETLAGETLAAETPGCRDPGLQRPRAAETLRNSWLQRPRAGIHPNLRSTVYCNAIAAGGAKEWEFVWSEFQKATIASEAEKLRSALSCSKQPWLLNRYLEYTLNSTLIRKQDATSTIVSIASNVAGQSLAWDFVRARWTYIFNEYGGGSFSFSNLINGVTKRFSTEYELQQLKQFKADNSEVGFGSGTLALDQSIERTISNIKWITENKQNVMNWFKAELKLYEASS